MIWGCFCAKGVGELVLVDGKMTETDYTQILNSNLKKSVQKVGLVGRYTFQQDNDPKHTSKVAKNFFEKSKIKLLKRPSQSPDLNPIENLWSQLDAKIPCSKRTNKEVFFRELKKVWDDIDEDITSKFVQSMPRRLEAVIKAKGGATKN